MDTLRKYPSILWLGVVLFLVALTTPAAFAGPYGTTAGTSIDNAKTADTLPLAAGELSVQIQSADGGGTTYVDTSTVVTTTVDTGFDMTTPTDISSSLADGNVSAGDSRVVKFLLANRGNNAVPVPFDLEHFTHSDSTAVKADSFTLELFHEAGDVAFDTSTATRVSGSQGSVNFAEGDTKSIFLIITPRDNATPGDDVKSELFLTDNAPIENGDNTTVGDQWENGASISGEDTNDTQFHDFTTTLQGSNIKVRKSLELVSGSARPGDTIQYTITAWNDGNAAADTTTVVDAIPDSTVYVAGADGDTLGGNAGNTDGPFFGGGTNLGFDEDFTTNGNEAQTASGITGGAENVARVVLDLAELKQGINGDGPAAGDQDTVQFSYQVTIE